MAEHKYDTTSVSSIREYSELLIGKTIGEIAEELNYDFTSNKGKVGQIIEREYFNIPNNSSQEPDFIEVGMELKVTPLKKLKNGNISAKERLVLTLINYTEDYDTDFYSSHLYEKMKHILIITYLHEVGKDISDFIIVDSLEYKIPEDDLPTILEDYNTVLDLINQGKAHEISESVTTYLGACTKGANGDSYRIQPNSNELAKQRAWSLKSSYMNFYYNKVNANSSSINVTRGTNRSLNDVLAERLESYYGLSEQGLVELFDLEKVSAKNKFQLLASGMLGIKGTNIDNIEEFEKSNTKLKTVRIEYNGKIKEDMSFETLDYNTIINEERFEDSSLYKTFVETTYLVMFFRADEYGMYRFDKFKRWSLSSSDICEVERYWNDLKKSLLDTIVIRPIQESKKVKFRYVTMPTSKKQNVFHCRTKGAGRRQPGTYKPIPDSVEVLIADRTFAKSADIHNILDLDNLPPRGHIHSMCTFVSSSVLLNVYKNK